MIDVVLKVLVMLGIILLVLLSLFLVALLLLLFFPFTYRAVGEKNEEGFRLSFKVNWLFGLFRARFLYPEPGRLRVKALCFTLFDSKLPPEKAQDAEDSPGKEDAEGSPGKAGAEGNDGAQKEAGSAGESSSAAESQGGSRGDPGAAEAEKEKETPQEENARHKGRIPPGKPSPEKSSQETSQEKSSPEKSFPEKISDKIREIWEKICGIYDKIKKIWKNISYYRDLMQEESTKQLAAHAAMRACKVLKSIRPRRMKGEILFGTGSPDTTGYLYGAYCAAAAILGTGFFVTPDFERKRLEGEFDVAGRIYMCVLLANGVRFILDKRLRVFLKRLKAGSGMRKEASA